MLKLKATKLGTAKIDVIKTPELMRLAGQRAAQHALHWQCSELEMQPDNLRLTVKLFVRCISRSFEACSSSTLTASCSLYFNCETLCVTRRNSVDSDAQPSVNTYVNLGLALQGSILSRQTQLKLILRSLSSPTPVLRIELSTVGILN